MADEKWSRKLDYILTVLGFALGVGGIWKFPYMCARNGGGSFLIPFTFFILIGSIPLTYLEGFVGQYSQLNCFDAWQICPALQGLAFGSMLVSWIFFIYTPVLLAWSLYYLYYSFSSDLPWTLCGQAWNSDNCVTNDFLAHPNSASRNDTHTKNCTENFCVDGNSNKSYEVSAAEEFFRNNMLQITDGLENMGEMRWPLTACLFTVFLCIYMCIVKGIRISGKVVYVTVISPYILVTVILIRACTLPGSTDGILYYITPDFERLKDPKIWMEACGVSIYSIGIGFGSLIKMASHNPVTNKCFRDAVVVNLVCLASQVYFGFSVFAITGHLAVKKGVNVDSFGSSGFKLGFITYPESTALLPLPQLWSVFLFLMLFTLGLDSLVNTLLKGKIPPAEFVASMVAVWFPCLGRRQWLLNGVVVFTSFLLSTPYTMQGGIYLMTLVDWFTLFPSLAVISIVELLIVGWIYGTSRTDTAMVQIWGKGLSVMMKVLWKFVCPCLFLTAVGYSLYSFRPPVFEDFVYEPWANVIGWCLSMGIVTPVPLYFVWSVMKAPGSSLQEKVKASLEPRGPWRCGGHGNMERKNGTVSTPRQTDQDISNQ